MSPSKELARLAADHRRAERALSRLDALADGEVLDGAIAACEELLAVQLGHHSFEETDLFPRFDRLRSRPARLTAVLRNEHRLIEELLEEMRAALADGARERFHVARRRLRAVLPEHELKEEHLLAPALAPDLRLNH
jgi:hypothetical protein